ncbi:LPS export ABC transporter permease LptF [Oceanibaculum nanhaiense]|uniref:LPS export ABC transporter permease LptF n=1 Tax=Oceanibaculum nanhaiense TaxID=1909734 RepID=UPI00396EE673
MVRRIDRYIVRQLVVAIFFVLVCLTAAIWLTQSLRLIDLIVNRGLPITTFLYLTVLLLPQFLALVLPVACFAAILFTYNRMMSDSEMVVMFGSGVGPLSLARPALACALGVTVIGYAIMLYFMPAAYRDFKDLQFQIRNNFSNVLLREGVFTSVGDRLTVFIRRQNSDGQLFGILIHDGRDAEKPETLIAEQGALVITDEGPRVVMVNGNRQTRDTQGRLNTLYFDRYTVEIGTMQQEFAGRWREPRERFLMELLAESDNPDDVRFRNRLITEVHNRLASPLLTIGFAMVGLAALFSGEFSRRGRTARVLAAVVIVLACQALFFAAMSLAQRNVAAVWLLYLPALLPALAGLYVLVRRRRRPPAFADPASVR